MMPGGALRAKFEAWLNGGGCGWLEGELVGTKL